MTTEAIVTRVFKVVIRPLATYRVSLIFLGLGFSLVGQEVVPSNGKILFKLRRTENFQ